MRLRARGDHARPLASRALDHASFLQRCDRQPKHPDDTPPEPWRTRGAANGADVLALLAADYSTNPGALLDTYTVTTPTGGHHLYCRQPTDIQLGNSAGRLGWKIDTRGHGGYVVGAGSTTPTGHYRTHTTTPPQRLPDWITAILDTTPPGTANTALSGTTPDLRNVSAYTLAALAGEIDNVLAAVPGQRNDTLNRAAFALGQLIGAQLLDHNTAYDELVSAADRIGLPRAEAERTITSGLTAGTRHPRQRTA
ncbi:bifunctional DNA primase/polymerase [Kribbella sp. NPDC050124]|uniref:bifunctional DNA primase/polymerase n=1 Tax=Kribbella sp. NPDC050124 TaxID=3364114 RepID=UPI0037B70000